MRILNVSLIAATLVVAHPIVGSAVVSMVDFEGSAQANVTDVR